MNQRVTTVSVEEAITQLMQSKIGIMPTDTVYGVACRATDVRAVARLYVLKQRKHKPGTIIATSIDQLVNLGIKRRYLQAVEHYWPNPISVVIPTGQSLEYIHQGVGSIAVRIPNDQSLQQLLQRTGPLVTSSANPPGKTPARNIDEARAYFGDQIDFYVDGGDVSDVQPSTIIRIVDDAVEVLRPGGVAIDESTGSIIAQ